VISARAKGVSTVPVPLMVPGVQDPDGPDRLDHLLGGARLPRRACPARGRAAGRTRSTRPVRPELPRSGRRGRAECGSRCPAGRSAGIVRPRDQGRTPPRASIGLLVQSPLGHLTHVFDLHLLVSRLRSTFKSAGHTRVGSSHPRTRTLYAWRDAGLRLAVPRHTLQKRSLDLEPKRPRTGAIYASRSRVLDNSVILTRGTCRRASNASERSYRISRSSARIGMLAPCPARIARVARPPRISRRRKVVPHPPLWGAPRLPDRPSIRVVVWKGEVIASTEEELLTGIQG